VCLVFKPKQPAGVVPDLPRAKGAGQVSDDRVGLSPAHARNWRRLAIAKLALADFFDAGW